MQHPFDSWHTHTRVVCEYLLVHFLSLICRTVTATCLHSQEEMELEIESLYADTFVFTQAYISLVK